MSLQTIAIIIGVSKYSQRDMENLPAAEVDAIHFARALNYWGIPESNIALFLDERAIKSEIDHFFANLLEKEEHFKFLFYFCGHGYRSEDIHSYLMLFDSYVENCQAFDSLNLDFLIQQVSQSNAVESYLFIDACSLRINKIINPKLEEELNGNKFSRKSLLCLLSSGIDDSFENEKEKYGYFTRALLNGLSTIDRVNGSPSQLLDYIHALMHKHNLPAPEMYNINNQKISFVPQKNSYPKDGVVYRGELISKIHDTVIQNPGKIICLIGDKNIGKSTLCHFFTSQILKAFSISIPFPCPNDFDLINVLTNTLVKKESFDFCSKYSSLKNLFLFCEQYPFYSIVIDNVERLNLRQMNDFLESICKLKINVIFASNQSLKPLINNNFQQLLIDYLVPPFSYDEGLQFMQITGQDFLRETYDMVHVVSRGNPEKMKKISFFSKHNNLDDDFFEDNLRKTIAAIYACGIFFDKQIFADAFNLEQKFLNFLEEIGLLIPTEDGYTPHTFFDLLAESEELIIDKNGLLNYWIRQITDTPNHLLSSKHFMLCVRCIGYEENLEDYLKIAIKTLKSGGKEYLNDLLESIEIFTPLQGITEASLFLAEALLDFGKFNFSLQLVNNKKEPPELIYRIMLCKIQIFWNFGQFEESMQLISSSLKIAKNNFQVALCYYNRGIVYYLMGKWSEALRDFVLIYENVADEGVIGRTLCMMGTILGIQGIDIEKGKSHLKKATILLEKIGDLQGLWACYNNYGEIERKCGEYKTSLFYLEKALNMSQSINNDNAALESLRNLLQLHLKWKGPYSEIVSTVLRRLESIDWDNCDSFNKMQLFNALATVNILQRNLKQSFFFIKKAFPLTVKNKNHHIYTLLNMSLLSKLLKREGKGEMFFVKAQKLAEETKNLLAVHEIKEISATLI